MEIATEGSASKRQLRVEPAQVAWYIERDAPGLLEPLKVPGREQVLLSARQAVEHVAVADQLRPFDHGDSFRPSGHSRAFYTRLGDEGVLATKGSEALHPGLRDAVREMRSVKSISSFWHHDAADYFVLVEKAFPMALHLPEALEEARRGAAFQQDHFRTYGELAKAPLPLAVIQIAERDCAAVASVYETELSERARASARKRMARGLAVYLYYLPGTPIRLRAFRGSGADGTPVTSLSQATQQLLDAGHHTPEDVLNRWFRLSARMLLLGYLPARMEDHIIGGCAMWHNMTVDGGMCDLASLRPMSDVLDRKEKFDSLMQLLAFFYLSSGTYILTRDLLGTPGTMNRGWHFNRWPGKYGFVNLALDRYVRAQLTEHLAREARVGLTLDPDVATFFAPSLRYAQVAAVLSGMYPSLDERGCDAVGHWLRTFVE
jgi:hypothetical protein